MSAVFSWVNTGCFILSIFKNKQKKTKQKHCKALPSLAVDKETVVTDDVSFSPPFVVILLYFHYLSTTLQVVLNFGKLNC